MLTASQVYTHSRLLLDAYAGIMRPLSAELNMAQTAVDILMFLANNPGYDTAKDICTMRHLKPGIFVPCGKTGSGRIPGAAECARGPEKVPVGLHGKGGVHY